jgi:hypothetical protein
MEFGIDMPASQMSSTIEAYAKVGIQPLLLAGFDCRLPSAEEARNVATWPAQFGPGGTLWKGEILESGRAAGVRLSRGSHERTRCCSKSNAKVGHAWAARRACPTSVDSNGSPSRIG